MIFLIRLLFFIGILNAADINFRKQIINSTTPSSNSNSSSEGIRFLLGFDAGIANIHLNRILESNDKKDISQSQYYTYNLALKTGIYSESGYFGGRIYAVSGYSSLNDFDILNLGLNLDFLINFLDSNRFNFGIILGIGGGMYFPLYKNPIFSPLGRPPFSPVGWVNTGVRLRSGIHSFEISYQWPYIYSSIYNDSLSSPTGMKSETYTMNAKFLNIGYILYF